MTPKLPEVGRVTAPPAGRPIGARGGEFERKVSDVWDEHANKMCGLEHARDLLIADGHVIEACLVRWAIEELKKT